MRFAHVAPVELGTPWVMSKLKVTPTRIGRKVVSFLTPPSVLTRRKRCSSLSTKTNQNRRASGATQQAATNTSTVGFI